MPSCLAAEGDYLEGNKNRWRIRVHALFSADSVSQLTGKSECNRANLLATLLHLLIFKRAHVICYLNTRTA